MADDKMADDADDVMSLGGNIELSGFREVDASAMIVLKKVVGNYVRRFSTICSSFEKLALHMKKVHEQVHSEKYEVHASVTDKGKLYTSTTTDRNLFFAVDAALKKVESEVSKTRTM